MAFASKPLLGGTSALLSLALAACGAPPPAEDASTNNAMLAPEDALAGSNAGADGAHGKAANEAEPRAGNETNAPEPTAAIPARFHGRWDASREACARTSSEMRLTVSASTLRFYESVGQVTGVRSAGDAVAVDLRTTGEGESRTETRTLRLAGDGQLVVESGGTSATRVRCPA